MRGWWQMTREVAGKTGVRLERLSDKVHHPKKVTAYADLEKSYLRPFTASEPFALFLQALSDGNDLSELQHELHEFDA